MSYLKIHRFYIFIMLKFGMFKSVSFFTLKKGRETEKKVLNLVSNICYSFIFIILVNSVEKFF